MADLPILMSAPMVRAILAGTKTQTRRVVKARKDPDYGCHMSPGEIAGDEHAARLCPYGQPGDLLWVRETHAPQADCWGSWERWARGEGGAAPVIHYAADAEPSPFIERWRPSIHMPRWASRITLRVTDVRVERLGDISEADAIAEGIGSIRVSEHDSRWANYMALGEKAAAFGDARVSFWSLWESINGRASRDANPWVWCLTFERVGGGNG